MAISRNRQRFLKEVLWGHMRSGVGWWDSQVWKHTMRGEEASVDELTLGWRDWQGWLFHQPVEWNETRWRQLKLIWKDLWILFCTSSQHINFIFVCCSCKHRRVSFTDRQPEESCKHPLPARGGLFLGGIISITSEVITWTRQEMQADRIGGYLKKIQQLQESQEQLDERNKTCQESRLQRI